MEKGYMGKVAQQNGDCASRRQERESEEQPSYMEKGTNSFYDTLSFFETVLNSEGNVDPIQVWGAFSGSSHLAELAEFAIMILIIVANQAGCERTFSRTKIEQSNHRNRLGLKKIDKRTKMFP
ncbi:hypothetical protein B0H10DRAFT_2322463 [Mycena sp. CBHHK59/15]|nr:hypothetical protein B0H10DRAFT_2322463 [Mycena sp. CBHHK59/15]